MRQRKPCVGSKSCVAFGSKRWDGRINRIGGREREDSVNNDQDSDIRHRFLLALSGISTEMSVLGLRINLSLPVHPRRFSFGPRVTHVGTTGSAERRARVVSTVSPQRNRPDDPHTAGRPRGGHQVAVPPPPLLWSLAPGIDDNLMTNLPSDTPKGPSAQ